MTNSPGAMRTSLMPTELVTAAGGSAAMAGTASTHTTRRCLMGGVYRAGPPDAMGCLALRPPVGSPAIHPAGFLSARLPSEMQWLKTFQVLIAPRVIAFHDTKAAKLRACGAAAGPVGCETQ